MIVVAFTGHRPSKLPGGYDIKSDENRLLAKRLAKELRKLMILCASEDTSFHYICGGAIGFDTIALSVCLALRKKFPIYNITIEMAIPFEDQPNKWSEIDQDRYYHHIELCDSTRVIA